MRLLLIQTNIVMEKLNNIKEFVTCYQIIEITKTGFFVFDFDVLYIIQSHSAIIKQILYGFPIE